MHAIAVDAWIARAGPAGVRLDAFERALAALWARAHATLGEITLGAIAERVLYVGSERYPALSKVTVEAEGIRLEALGASGTEARGPALAEACRWVLIELLTVIGNLTAEILTPALHAELAALGSGPAGKVRS